jgi:hypothetical protein
VRGCHRSTGGGAHPGGGSQPGLRDHGIEELVDAARQAWQERAAIGDLQALTARSRVSEGAALTDLTGLGAFRVVEWRMP